MPSTNLRPKCAHARIVVSYRVAVYCDVDRDTGEIDQVRLEGDTIALDGTDTMCLDCYRNLSDDAPESAEAIAIAESRDWPSWS